MNGDNPVDRLMTELGNIINEVESLKRRMTSDETISECHSKCLDMHQDEIERLAVKVYSKKPTKPRKARSDRGKKRAKKGEGK